LQDHFDRHGRDFSSKSPDDYAAQAWLFLQRARAENLPMKLDETDGTLRVFDPATRVFAAYNGAGRTKTFFKPDNPTYWQRQPGRVVKAAELRFSTR
jgi:pyocin large subunit-like protein